MELLQRRLGPAFALLGAGLRQLAPFVDLWVRLSLAQVFFVSGMLKLTHWQDALRLARYEYPVSWLDPHSAAVLSVGIEVAGPVLLALGLLVRPAALAMLLLSLVIQISYQQLDVNLFWIALSGWYLVHGPGALSFDRALAQGLATSAVPLAAPAVAAGAWTERIVGPFYRLALRLWLALALAGFALPAVLFPVTTCATLPRLLAWIAATLLALGLGTSLIAGVLLIAFSGIWAMVPADGVTIFAPLLFALLGIGGAGRFSLDAPLRRAVEKRRSPRGDEPHIVIVGAGFAGMACAAGLRHARARVTLVDRRNYHLFQPLLYQVATASLSPGDIAAPIRAVFREDARITVLCGTVSAVDPSRRMVRVDGNELAYDYLVLATGASHGYFGNEHWARYAPGLKMIEDAVSIRGRILAAFERAEASPDSRERAKLLTLLICGGGPTGVELAGAIAELARHGLTREFRRFDPASARVILVQAGPRLLPAFPEKLSMRARLSLEQLGVEVWLDSRVEAVDHEGAVVNGKRIAAGIVLWAAGVVASPAASWLGQQPDPAGRLPVAADLSVPGLPDVFAIGDTALARAWKGAPVPGLAPAAKQEGAYVAAVLRARLSFSRAPPPFRYRHHGSLATIGRKSAVADFGWITLRGTLAWWLWGAVHILFLVGLRNRLSVIVGWLWSYLTYRVGVQLITGDASRSYFAAPLSADQGDSAK
ncbi:MAG TPA: FAD-dependent oxidoreductase [Acetobacteraceae bacterium]|nr:FAD-dependent oxidoreductase [Acetobacteraceae bacterium]